MFGVLPLDHSAGEDIRCFWGEHPFEWRGLIQVPADQIVKFAIERRTGDNADGQDGDEEDVHEVHHVGNGVGDVSW